MVTSRSISTSAPARALSCAFLAALILVSSPWTGMASPDVQEPADAAPAADVGPADVPLTLDECLRLAREQSALVVAARHNLGMFEAKLFEARWAWFPQGKIEASIGPTPAKRGNPIYGETDFDEWGPLWKVRAEAAAPIYTFGKLAGLKRAAEAGVDVAQDLVALARAEASYRVRQAYYGWLLAKDLIEIVEEGRSYLDKAERRLKKMEMEDDPEYDQVDLLRLRVYRADVEQMALEARRLEELSRFGMRLILGREEDGEPFDPTAQISLARVDLEPVDVELGELGTHLARAEEHEPMTRAGRAGVRARTALADVAEAGLYPDFYVGGYISYSGSPVADPQDSPFAYDPWNSWFGGAAVGVRYTIDIPQKVARWRQALAEAAYTEQIARIAASRAALDVEKAYREAVDMKHLLSVFRRAQRAARSWLMAKSDLYDAGFGELKEVTDALVEFYKRKLGYLQGIYEFNMAVARLSQTTGADLFTAAPE